MKLMVKHCARCNNDHEVEFVEFQHFGIGDCNWWGMCPYINEPIIMKIVTEEHEETSAEILLRADKETKDVEPGHPY